MTPPARRGAGLFWAALLAFVVVDLAFLVGPALGPWIAQAAPALAYLLLAGAALSLGWIAATAALAWRERRWPGVGAIARGLVLLVILGVHLGLIWRTHHR